MINSKKEKKELHIYEEHKVKDKMRVSLGTQDVLHTISEEFKKPVLFPQILGKNPSNSFN